jgi:hypothetical protein
MASIVSYKFNSYSNILAITADPKGGVLEQIKAFLQEYPEEVIFIDLIYEYGRDLDDHHKAWIYRRCVQAFGYNLVNQSDKDTWCKIDKVTLPEMIDRNKNVWLLVEDPLRTMDDGTIMEAWRAPGYIPRTESWFSEWYNSQSVEKTFNKNLEHASTMGSRDTFKGTSITITPSGSCCYVFCSILGCKSLRVDNVTSKFHKNDLVHYFSKKNKGAGSYWNFVIFDFMEWQPYLNRFLIGLNYHNYDLIITSAVVQSKSNSKQVVKVDNAIASHIIRNNTLWIVDFKKDLGISFSSGQIAVGYQFVPNAYNPDPNELPTCGVSAFEFNDCTKFLLNFYNHKTHGTVWQHNNSGPIPPNAPGMSGLVADGKVMVDASMPVQGNMVMEYTKD